jgi:hypothetical protein
MTLKLNDPALTSHDRGPHVQLKPAWVADH